MTGQARVNSVKPVPGQYALQVAFADGERYDFEGIQTLDSDHQALSDS